MRIVVLADSYALPRLVENDEVHWEDTWPYLLQNTLRSGNSKIEVINCGKRKRTIDSIIGWDFQEHIIFKEPDVVLIQIGIVDAAPRIISKKERATLNHRLFPAFLRKKIIETRKKNKVRITKKDPLAKVYTKPDAFHLYLLNFKKRIDSDLSKKPKVIFIPITAYFKKMGVASPYFQKNVEAYNAILQKFTNEHSMSMISLPEGFSENQDYFCNDGYHLSPQGNRTMAQIISKNLS